ncbi:MAG TPA: type I DNA topoisomerase [candidate division Zixibacteria bacterium]|nr:type I DNA topoisomerase [candidate division Zixibacteria bacterium]
MSKNLVIVESPTKTKTLARFLGKDYQILATIGHIIDLPKSKLGIDVEHGFQPDYNVIKGKEKVISELKKAAKKADTIYLAPDPDREGEAIAWHVANNLKPGKDTQVLRVSFNEITESAVKSAIANPRELDLNLVNAQQARRVLDRLVGYTVSPFLWKTITHSLSAGRVQSVALRLVCERDEEIARFQPQEYWQIEADLQTQHKEKFKARLTKIDDRTVVAPQEKETAGKITIGSEEECQGYIKELEQETYRVADLKQTERVRRPLPPFITSTLQQEAARAIGLTPKATMTVAQQLYEGIELGKEGPTGLITYMRTDSPRIAKEALGAARKYIGKEFGDAYLPSKPVQYSRKGRAQDAHEAIRPTYMSLSPEKLRKKLTPRQFKLYQLIWNRFVASQMNAAVYDVATVDITAGRFLLRTTAQKLKFDGFLRVYQETKEADDANGNGNGNGLDNLPKLAIDETLKLLGLTPSQSFTKPPARFSEASLVKQLEADGIGRPSTYATIISTLKDRKYVDVQERKLHPTDLGRAVNKILVDNFPDLFNVKFTAEMEKELDQVEEGSLDWVKLMQQFYGPFNDTLQELKGKEGEIKKSMVEMTEEKCEKCGSPMVIKWGRNGRFLACSSYPECRNTRPLPEEEARAKTNEKCEKCGRPMVIKTGRFGRFMACSGYPECKNTKAITIGVKCPREGCGGQLVEKQTRSHKIFYGCSNYPKCDYASWDMPVNQACPACHYPFMVLKTSKKKGDFLRCPECKTEVPVQQNDTPEPEKVGATS